MSDVLRRSRAALKRLSATAAATSVARPSFQLNSLTIGTSSSSHDHRLHKWDGNEYNHIRADFNCPRCSKQIPILSITGREPGVYLALNRCPCCRTDFYFRPFKLEPLQGSFNEIGRVSAKDMERHRDSSCAKSVGRSEMTDRRGSCG